jgi:hypothetical protein
MLILGISRYLKRLVFSIEYHNGYKELKKLLEDLGFHVKIKSIRSSPQPIEKQGYVVAKRSVK